MRFPTSYLRLSNLLIALASLTACGLQDDYQLTLECRGKVETLSKKPHEPADEASRDEARRYAFKLHELEGYSCHTWRKDKIACIHSLDDEDTFLHESLIIHRQAMTIEHVATLEKKRTGLTREENFQGKCTRSSESD